MPFFPQLFRFGSLSSLGQQFSLLQVWTYPSMRVFNQGAGEIWMLNNNCDAKAVCVPFRNYIFSFWNSWRISLPWRTASQIQIHLVRKVKSKRQLLVNRKKFIDLRRFVLISTTVWTSPVILESGSRGILVWVYFPVPLEGFVLFESGDRRNALEQKVTWTGLCLRFAGRVS